MKQAVKYFIFFVLYQTIGSLLVTFFFMIKDHGNPAEHLVDVVVAGSALASLLTIATFLWRRWCPVSLNYLKSNPWLVLLLSLLAAAGSLLPSAGLMEMAPDFMQKDLAQDAFEALFDSPYGYIVIGILAPLTEEIVFRGAVLRSLLSVLREQGNVTQKGAWTAIGISAMFFSIAHFNPAQMPHAFVLGLLMGWLYYYTGSIVPGMVFHWMNNSVAFLFAVLFPDKPYDAKLIEYFNGDTVMLEIAIGVSLVVFVASLYLLNKRFSKQTV